MSDRSIMIVFGFIVLIAFIVGAWYLVRMWLSPDVERYSRMAIQGPLAPFGEEDITAEKRQPEEHDRS